MERLPNKSFPVLAIKCTFPFNLAAATAWLAPLPPGFIMKLPPMIVSPGTGRRSALMTISVLQLPITMIFLLMAILLV